MATPYDVLLNPSYEQLYDDLQLDYFYSRMRRMFPSVLSANQEYSVFIKLMAWACANSFRQVRIIKYIYNPWLVVDFLLPKLADTLDFKYPVNYPYDKLRLLIKYLQKIRKLRGTLDSIRMLIRLLNTTEEDILNMSLEDYSSVEIQVGGKYTYPGVPVAADRDYPSFMQEYFGDKIRETYNLKPGAMIPQSLTKQDQYASIGFMFIRYTGIEDWEFTNRMLEMVVPAGYDWRLETPVFTQSKDNKGVRNRVEMLIPNESASLEWAEYIGTETVRVKENIILTDEFGNILDRRKKLDQPGVSEPGSKAHAFVEFEDEYS